METQDRFMLQASFILNVLVVCALLFLYVKASPFFEMKDDVKQVVDTVKTTGDSVNELIEKTNAAADAVGEDYRRVRDTATSIRDRVGGLIPFRNSADEDTEEDSPPEE